MDVKQKIVSLIPLEWEEVLRREKVLTKFCSYVSRDSVMKKMKNGAYFKNVEVNLNRGIARTNILYCFNYMHTTEGAAFWNDIDIKIKNHIQLCQ